MNILHTKFIQNLIASPLTRKLLSGWQPKADAFLLKVSRGWLSIAIGQPIIRMETIGAKSGIKRVVALACMPRTENGEQQIILVASNWGQAKHPAWYHNLKANEDVAVCFRGYVGNMKAKELEGEEKAKIWEEAKQFNSGYVVYEERITQRSIPVIMLRREP